jgi:hypothetical protein
MRPLIEPSCRPWPTPPTNANNRAEVSHQPARERERQMPHLKSAAHVQRFASVHGVVQNLFRVGRHLLPIGSPPAAAKAGIPRLGYGDLRRLIGGLYLDFEGKHCSVFVNLTVPR